MSINPATVTASLTCTVQKNLYVIKKFLTLQQQHMQHHEETHSSKGSAQLQPINTGTLIALDYPKLAR